MKYFWQCSNNLPKWLRVLSPISKLLSSTWFSRPSWICRYSFQILPEKASAFKNLSLSCCNKETHSLCRIWISDSSFWKINKYFGKMLATKIRLFINGKNLSSFNFLIIFLYKVLDDIDFCIAKRSVKNYCINPGHCSIIFSKTGFRVNHRESTCLRNAWIVIPSSSWTLL